MKMNLQYIASREADYVTREGLNLKFQEATYYLGMRLQAEWREVFSMEEQFKM